MRLHGSNEETSGEQIPDIVKLHKRFEFAWGMHCAGTIDPIHEDLRRWSLSSVHLKWILVHHVWGTQRCS